MANTNLLIIAPLLFMIILSAWFTMYQIQPLTIEQNLQVNGTNVSGGQNLNGTSTSYEQTGSEYALSVTTTLGLIAVLAICEIAGVVAGIQVLGSGLNDVAVSIIYKTLGMTVLWTILSVIGVQVLWLIPFGFGILGYLILTLLYAIGVIQSVGS